MNVIIAEDEALIRKALSLKFQKEKHSVISFSSGVGVVEALNTNEFDLAILDVIMPDIGARELLLDLDKKSFFKKKSTCIILMSAYIGDWGEEQAVMQKANLFIPKPFRLNEFYSLAMKAISPS